MVLKQTHIVSLILVLSIISLGGTSDHTVGSIAIDQSQIYQKRLSLLADSVSNDSFINQKRALIESSFQKLKRSRGFNGCVLVSQHGNIIYKESFGVSDGSGKKLTDSSVFQLASVSKTITAACALLLIERGQLGLDDFVGHYLRNFRYSQVTIRDLLTHRSGIPDYTKISRKWYPAKRYYSNQDAVTALNSAKLRLEFPIGSRFDYNNSNYAILALIIERIAGQPFPEFVKENIFDPLGMHNSFIADPEKAKLNSNTTRSHHGNDKLDGVFGDKGAYSTVEDLYKFHMALQPGVILTKETLETAFTNTLRGSKGYGLGFRLRLGPGYEKIIFHNGWWHGYRTAFHRREPDNSCVIILSNRLDAIVYSKPNEIFKILNKF